MAAECSRSVQDPKTGCSKRRSPAGSLLDILGDPKHGVAGSNRTAVGISQTLKMLSPERRHEYIISEECLGRLFHIPTVRF